MNDADIKSFVEGVKEQGVEIIKLEWMGLDLILRNMATSVENLEDAIKNGIGVTKAQQSFNVLDHLVSDGRYGSQSSEFKLVPDVETFSPLPHVKGVGRMQTELSEPEDLSPTASDPRYFLRRMIGELSREGIRATCGLEAEFYLFNAEDLSPIISGKLMDSLGMDLLSDFILDLKQALGAMGIEVEHLKKEYGGSQFEITYRYGDPLKVADQFIVMKSVVRSMAASRGMVASFMPKVSTESPGSGLHIHMALYNSSSGENIFFNSADKRGMGMSPIAYKFIGGLIHHMGALCAFENPLSNSYKRLIPGSWAPAHVSYGYDHRGVAVRIPSDAPGMTQSKRIEFRLPDCSANPHIAVGAMIAAGLDGIRKSMDPGEGLDYEPANLSPEQLVEEGVRSLPTTLVEAIQNAERDQALKKYMGDVLFEEYIKVRKSEWEVYYKNVDKWEVDNFLEYI